MANIGTIDLILDTLGVGHAAMLEDEQPVEVTFDGKTFLESGNIETDPLKFDGAIFTETTILDGTLQTTPHGSFTINACASNGTVFVIGGSSGLAAKSVNGGVTWTTINVGFGASTINNIRLLNGIFVCVGASGKLSTSSDGETWILRTTPNTNEIFDVSFGNSLYIAVLGSDIIKSSNLVSWALKSHNLGAGGRGIVFGTGYFALAGTSSPFIETSLDGEVWVTGITFGFGLTSITFGNNLFAASVQANADIVISSDVRSTGVSFVSASAGATVINSVEFLDDKFFSLNQTAGDLFHSVGDGVWTNATTIGSGIKQSACIQNNEIVVVGGLGDVVLHSQKVFAGVETPFVLDGESQYIRTK